jgi:hypothetical protein
MWPKSSKGKTLCELRLLTVGAAMVEVATLELTARTDGLKRAETALAALVPAAARAEDATDKLTTATERASKAQEEAAKKSEEGKRGHDQMRAALDQLRASIDPVYASSRRYETALEQVNAAVKAGAISQGQASVILQRAETAYLGATNKVDQLGGAMAQATRSAGATRMGFQNLGYQVQDFAVQVGSGQSATVALGQQLPQLLSGFGLLGIALGTASAVLIPLAGYFLSNADGAETFADALDGVREASDELASTLDIANTPLAQLVEQFGVGSVRVREMSAALAELQMLEALDALDAATSAVGEGLEDLRGYTDGLAELYGEMAQGGSRAAADIELQQQRIQEAYGISAAEATKIIAAMDALERATGPQEQAIAARSLADALMGARNEAGQIPPQLRGTARAALEAAIEAEKIAGPLQRSLDAAQELAATSFGGDWLGAGIAAAQNLAGSLWDAVAAKAALAETDFAGMGDDERGSQRDVRRDVGGLRSQQAVRERMRATASSGRGGGGGGGGGGGDGFQGRLESLQQELMSEQEVLDQWYQESQAILMDRRAMELLGEAEHKAALEALELEHQERLRNIQGDVQNTRLADTASFFGGMASLAAAGGDKLASAARTFGAAEALVNTYVAFTAVLRDPSFIGRPLARIGAAAAVLAQGLGAVRAIKGGGGGGGGSVGSAAVGSQPADVAAAQDRVIRVSVEGDTMFAEALRGSIRTIADALGEERNIGGFVVS